MKENVGIYFLVSKFWIIAFYKRCRNAVLGDREQVDLQTDDFQGPHVQSIC